MTLEVQVGDFSTGGVIACSGLLAGTTVAGKRAATDEVAGSGENTLTHGGSSGGNRRLWHYRWTPAADVSWDAGTWTVRFNLTTANMNLTWESVHICHTTSTDSNLAVIGSLTGIGQVMDTAGVKSVNVSGSARTPGANDRVWIVLGFTNGSTMAQSIGITASEIVTSPFTVASGPVTHDGQGAIAGTGGFASSGALLALGSAALDGVGGFTADAVVVAPVQEATGSIDGTGGFTAAAERIATGQGAIAGSGGFTAAASIPGTGPPQVTSITKNGETTNGTKTLVLPGSSQAYLLLIGRLGGTVSTPPANWTLVEDRPSNDPQWNRLYVYAANAADNPGTSYATSGTSGSGDVATAWLVVGFDRPIDIASLALEVWANYSGEPATWNSPAGSTAVDDTLVLRLTAANLYDDPASVIGYPAATDNNDQRWTNSGSGANDGIVVAVATTEQITAGAVGTATWSAVDGINFVPVAATLAVASAAGPVTHNADGSIAGAGGIAGDILAIRPDPGVSIDGSGGLTTAVQALMAASGGIASTGALDASTAHVRPESGTIAGVGALQAEVVVIQAATATLAGTGGLTGETGASGVQDASAALAGTGALNVGVAATYGLSEGIAGVGGFASSAVVVHEVSAAIDGTGILEVDDQAHFIIVGSIDGVGGFEVTYQHVPELAEPVIDLSVEFAPTRSRAQAEPEPSRARELATIEQTRPSTGIGDTRGSTDIGDTRIERGE